MADEIDRANTEAELDLQRNIERARMTTASLPGPAMCACGQKNDRRAAGWATCTDCESEMEIARQIQDYADDGRK